MHISDFRTPYIPLDVDGTSSSKKVIAMKKTRKKRKMRFKEWKDSDSRTGWRDLYGGVMLWVGLIKVPRGRKLAIKPKPKNKPQVNKTHKKRQPRPKFIFKGDLEKGRKLHEPINYIHGILKDIFAGKNSLPQIRLKRNSTPNHFWAHIGLKKLARNCFTYLYSQKVNLRIQLKMRSYSTFDLYSRLTNSSKAFLLSVQDSLHIQYNKKNLKAQKLP
jgi:hypothetical protein